MAEERGAEHWDQRYHTGDLPWDSGLVDEELMAAVRELMLGRGRALEIGCGTGTNAIWLARQGLDTVASDIAPQAIELAKEKVRKAAVPNLRLLCADILEALPVAPASVDLVFDRGCFHVMPPQQRRAFAQRVAEALRPGGWWLTHCGNADEQRGDQPGPPQLTATQISSALEPRFEIHRLRRSWFIDAGGKAKFLSWACLGRRRTGAEPA